ncbi:MAG: toxin-antitoxin (TA) system antitoxin [Kangiella sp.]|nr:MAG: toxin-antitoxin (TA) system antitoxin [Kangiella sp.]
MSVHSVTVDEANGHLAELIELVEKGEEVVITHRNQARIKLVACPSKSKSRVAGLHQNAIKMSDDFNESLGDDFWMGQSTKL